MLRKGIVLILLLGLNFTAEGQWYFSVGVDREWNSNPFHFPEASETWITAITAQLQRNLSNSTFQYSGYYTDFQTIPERNFYWHQLYWGIGSDTLHFGSVLEQRINREDYNLYDYQSGRVFLQTNFQKAGFRISLQNNFVINRFLQVSQLNHWQAAAYLSLNRSFASRTTILLGMGVYFKKYLRQATAVTIWQPDVSNSHRGTGRGFWSSRQAGMIVTSADNTQELSQLLLNFRVAQAVFSRTGIAVYGSRRFALTGADQSFSGFGENFFDESQLFDDPLSYQSLILGSDLTQILPGQTMLRASFFYMRKDYVSQGIYKDSETLEPEILRRDRLWGASVNMQRSFGLNREQTAELLLELTLSWIRDHSNSYWYDFQTRSMIFGIEISL